jgi:hypothetical protein
MVQQKGESCGTSRANVGQSILPGIGAKHPKKGQSLSWRKGDVLVQLMDRRLV